MSKKNNKEAPNNSTIIVDGKEHIIENMTKEQKLIVQHIMDLSNKTAQISFSLDQLRVSQEAFERKLIESLKADEETSSK